jgi:hypothetical protein
MWTGLASTMLLWGVAACGGGELDPGAGNAAGDGNRTLTVDGIAHASPHQINARLSADFDTEFSVRVSLAGQTVTTASVAITSSTGKIALTLRGDGRWSGASPGYDQVYVLDAVSGGDTVERVRVDGPDIHVFSQPTEGETVDATEPLALAWSRDAPADATTLRAEDTDALTIADTGSYALAAGSLKTEQSQLRPNTLRLTCTNRIVPAGAAAGSSWTVAIDNAINVVARPQIPLPL